jgi:hypothetical protein
MKLTGKSDAYAAWAILMYDLLCYPNRRLQPPKGLLKKQSFCSTRKVTFGQKNSTVLHGSSGQKG